jgi:peptide/nickel transport system ATP-binding protein
VISRGSVKLEGRELLTMSEGELRQIRWRRIAMVFQSAMDALNPVIPIGEQIIDTLKAHTDTNPRAARERAAELLTMVGIPTSQLDAYAHQLSGGMRQRVGIALALALKPAVVILDEPTTALDVIVEREILEQIRMLQQKLGFAVIFITHDLGRMLQFSDRVAIFYAARLVEVGPAAAMATASKHPYTQGLLRATPSIRDAAEGYASIPGSPPSLASPPSGCRFHPRCALAMDVCKGERPPYVTIGPGHIAACYAVEQANVR